MTSKANTPPKKNGIHIHRAASPRQKVLQYIKKKKPRSTNNTQYTKFVSVLTQSDSLLGPVFSFHFAFLLLYIVPSSCCCIYPDCRFIPLAKAWCVCACTGRSRPTKSNPAGGKEQRSQHVPIGRQTGLAFLEGA